MDSNPFSKKGSKLPLLQMPKTCDWQVGALSLASA